MTPQTVKAYVNGRLLCADVVQAALDLRLLLADMKILIARQYPGVVFKVE
jgi:hypothetical protein